MIDGCVAASTHPAACGRKGSCDRRVRARGSPREPRRDRQRGEAELARDVGAGQHAVAGDVVRPGRARSDDALQEGLADVVLVDELHGKRRDERWQRHRRAAHEHAEAPAQLREGFGQELPGADRVRPEDDRRAQQVEVELRTGARLGVQEALDLRLLPGVEEVRPGTRGPVLGDSLGVVAVEAVGGDRRGVDETLRAGRGCGPERVERAVDVDRSDRLARHCLPVIMNARCTTMSARGRRPRARPYSIFVQPYSAGSKGRRAMPTISPIRSSCSSGMSPKPKVPVGPVTATVSGAAEAAMRGERPYRAAGRGLRPSPGVACSPACSSACCCGA